MKNLIAPLIGLAAGLLTASSLSAGQPLDSPSLAGSFQEPVEAFQIAMGRSPSGTRSKSSRTELPARAEPSVSGNRSVARACRPPYRIPGQWRNCSRHSTAGR